MPECARLRGPIDLAELERALNQVAARHETLRTTFATQGGQPVQNVAPQIDLRVEVERLEHLPADQREIAARQRMHAEADRPFDLVNGPLARLKLVRTAEDDHWLLLNLHHIISDGWSTANLIHELGECYTAALAGRAPKLPALRLQYADYALWQREWLSGSVLAQHLEYWKDKLLGLRALSLPRVRVRPAEPSYRGGFEELTLPLWLVERLSHFAAENNATLFMALLAGFQTLLQRLCGQDDVPVGVPIAGRDRPELEPLIGLFANTVVLRTDLSGKPSFRELVTRVREVVSGAFAHQSMPFEKLVEELNPSRDAAHNPLFQVMFILQNTPRPAIRLPGIDVTLVAAGTLSVKFDMLLELYLTDAGIRGWLGYSADVFDANTMRRTLEAYREILEAAVADPASSLGSLAPATQARELADTFNEDL